MVEASANLAHITRTAYRSPSGAAARLIDSFDEFAALAQPWGELHAKTGAGPFVSHRFLTAWWEAYGTGAELSIATQWMDGQLVAAAPLFRSRDKLSAHLPIKANVLQMLASHRTGYNEWMIAPESGSAGALVDVLRDAGRFALGRLEPVRIDANHAAMMAAMSDRGFPAKSKVAMVSAVADLSKGWDAYLAARASNFRRDFRAAERRINERKGRVLTSATEGSAVVERALSVSRKSWKGTAGTAIGSSDAGERFLRRLFELMGPDCSADIAVLEVDGENAASHLALVQNGTAYGLINDFREEFTPLSPGRFMIGAYMRRAASGGIATVDLLRATPFLLDFAAPGYELALVVFHPGRTPANLWYEFEQLVAPIGAAARHAARRRKRRRAGHKDKTKSRIAAGGQ